MMKRLLALMVLTTLTACDYVEKRELRKDRQNRSYQEAMADYQAGRLEAAIAGFEKIARSEPGNAAARFQLACLLQDVRKDYLGAFCAYREYIFQHANSDKAKLAEERCDSCARELAKKMAEHYGLTKTQALQKEIELLKQELSDANMREASLKKELEASRTRVDGLVGERTRLLAMIKGEGVESTDKPKVGEVKDLLDEEDDEDRTQVVEDLSKLKGTGKPIVKDPKPVAVDAPSHEKRPETYVVQDGDTLMRLAIRFYGFPAAWHRIRDANKALISTDGRIRVGDTIKLP